MSVGDGNPVVAVAINTMLSEAITGNMPMKASVVCFVSGIIRY